MKSCARFAVACLLFAAGTARAESTAARSFVFQDIHITTSGYLEWKLDGGELIMTGGVKVKDRDLDLDAQKVTIRFAAGGTEQVKEVLAEGKVKLTAKLKGKQGEERIIKGEAERTSYLRAQEQVKLVGSPATVHVEERAARRDLTWQGRDINIDLKGERIWAEQGADIVVRVPEEKPASPEKP